MADYSTYAKWRTEGLSDGDGIIVGCSQSQEWLLPWWWLNYRVNNSYPVAFADFGMGERGKQWCKRRGELIPLDVPDDFVVPKENIEPARAKIWESVYRYQFWPNRISWFKKPLALLRSPFRRTLWIDLDCQVVKSIECLFPHCENSGGISISPTSKKIWKEELEKGLRLPDEIIYNSGVVVYLRNSPIISVWAEDALENNDLYIGDQHQLSRIIYNMKFKIDILPRAYHYRNGGLIRRRVSKSGRKNPNFVGIYHWLANDGKKYIRTRCLYISTRLNISFNLNP